MENNTRYLSQVAQQENLVHSMPTKNTSLAQQENLVHSMPTKNNSLIPKKVTMNN